MPLYSSSFSLTVEEEDGTPTVAGVTKIQVSNGTMTDDGAGVVSFDITGGASDLSGAELAYAQITTNFTTTATTEATAGTVVTAGSVVFDGSTVVMIEFYAEYVQPVDAQTCRIHLFDDTGGGAAIVGRLGLITPPATTFRYPVRLSRRLTPSNATHTYSIRAHTDSAGTLTIGAGNGGTGAGLPAFIRITRV